jgi:hypothetical protein
MTLERWTILCGILGATAAACSSAPTGDATISRGDTKGAGGGSNGGGAALGGDTGCQINCGSGGGNGTAGLNGAGGFDQSKVCPGNAFKAEALPVDMYIMFDQSVSMADQLPDGSGTWWAAAQGAVKSFVNNSKAVGQSVGIQYFPLGGVAPASCTAPYSTPDVELGLIPANSAALVASIEAHSPTAFTPTAPALQGAIDHMKAWAPNHLGHAPVVVFVTDGFPTECPPQQPADIAILAKTAFETIPKVRTFVVGFNLGQGGQNLNQIAKAGGTNKAFLIDNGDIGAAFVNAMLSIASQPLNCSLDIPQPKDSKLKLDPALVDVRYTPSATGVTDHVRKLNNLGECDTAGGQGWYYDSPSAPTKILVCPGTCAGFAAGVIETVNGCSPDEPLH